MSILNNKSSVHYYFIKQCIEIPLIFVSATLAILNSNFDSGTIRILNIVCNSVTAVLINLNSRLQINEKYNLTKELALKFDKIEANLEKLVNLRQLTEEKIQSIITQYENTMESCPTYPVYIKDRVLTLCSNLDVPYILNGRSERRASSHIVNINTL